MTRRLQAMGIDKYKRGFSLTMHDSALDAPLSWKKPRTVFVNSMSDLFHNEVSDEFIHRVFAVMASCPQHRFQVLTKRSARLLQMTRKLAWKPNIWMGVSVEDSRQTSRIDDLRKTGAAVKFLSLEPLLGPLQLDLRGINWVIVGGESGPGARPMDPAWVLDIRDQCNDARVAFFFKQWGGQNKKKAGRLLEGTVHDAMPVSSDYGASRRCA
jgi:protein gp37